MPSDPTVDSSWYRLHPSSLFFSVGSVARGFLVPGLFVLFASRGSGYELWLMMFFFPATIVAVIKYLNYSYRFTDEELVIREGVINRNERNIRWDRIQNIDQVQNPLHRLFSVAEVRLETASGGKPEAVIRVLSLGAVEALRAQVFVVKSRAAAPVEAVVPEDRVLLRLSPRELVLFGLISSRGMTVVAAVMGLLWQFDLFDWWENPRIDEYSRQLVQLREQLPLPGPLITGILAVAGIFVALVILRVLASLWYAIKFHGFTLRRNDDDMRTEYGLLTRVSATIPQHRIQKISTRSGPMHRFFKRAVVQVETAGGSEGGEGTSVNRQWLAPLVPEEHLARLLREVVPEVDLDQVDWQPMAARAGRRVRWRSMVVVLLLIVVSMTLAGVSGKMAAGGLAAWSLVLLALGLPLALVNARLYVAYTGYAVTPEAVFFRSGWWDRRTSAVLFQKIQTLTVEESPFDRRHRMAAFRVDTAGAGRIGHRIRVPYLDGQVARELLQRLSLEADRRAFQW